MRSLDGPIRSIGGPNRSIDGPNRSIDSLPLERVNLIDLGVANEPKEVRSRVLAGTKSVLCPVKSEQNGNGQSKEPGQHKVRGALFQLMRRQMRTLMNFHLLDDADPQAGVIELPSCLLYTSPSPRD